MEMNTFLFLLSLTINPANGVVTAQQTVTAMTQEQCQSVVAGVNGKEFITEFSNAHAVTTTTTAFCQD